jgi:Transposase IS116/IS110/IS902 family
MIATATVAAVGNGRMFKTGRGMAAWLGLVPRQPSTGGDPFSDLSARGEYPPATSIHPGRTGALHAFGAKSIAFGSVVTGNRRPNAPRRSRRGARQQTRADLLESAFIWTAISAVSATSNLIRVNEDAYLVLRGLYRLMAQPSTGASTTWVTKRPDMVG